MSQYSTLFEDLYARVNDSVKGAWKIFGRVVARQSLLELSADFDALRRDSTALASDDSAETPELARLLKTEKAVVENLAINERGFRQSEGNQWYTGMHDDVARLVALRESLLQLNDQLHLGSHDLAEEAASIAASVPGKVEAPWSPSLSKKGKMATAPVQPPPRISGR